MRFPALRCVALLAVVCATGRAAGPPGTGATDPAAAFEGTWLGEVTAPNARTAIGFAFQRSPRGLVATFYMPDMFVYGLTLGETQVEERELTFPPLASRFRRDGARLTGTFGLAHLPMELHRVEKFPPAPAAPVFPAAPVPVWTATLGAEAWASPVVRDDTIYVGTVDGKLHALDAANGRERWAFAGPNPFYGAALVTAMRVYAVDARTDLVCLDRADGHLVWRAPLFDAALAGAPPKTNETFNHRTPTPVLVDNTLYIGSSDGGVYALDAANGAVKWRHDTKTKIYATLGVDGDDLLVGGFDGTVLALNRRTQKETARTKLPDAVVSTPVVSGNTVVAGCRDYLLYGLKRADLSIAWRYSYWFSWIESTPALVDGTIYIGGSDFARVSALDPATSKPRWATVVHGIAWGTPLVTADAVFEGTSAQGDAIIRHEGGIVALDRRTGAVKWRQVVPLAKGAARAGYIGSLALAGGNVIAVGFDGTVIALPVR